MTTKVWPVAKSSYVPYIELTGVLIALREWQWMPTGLSTCLLSLNMIVT